MLLNQFSGYSPLNTGNNGESTPPAVLGVSSLFDYHYTPTTSVYRKVKLDSENNLICVGFTLYSNKQITFLTKTDKDGNLIWARALGFGNNYSAYDVLIDSNDNYYVLGNNEGAYYIFFAKYNKDGELLLLKTNTNFHNGCSFTDTESVFDNEGNLVVTFKSGAANGSYKQFVVKLDKQLNVLWAKAIDSYSDYFTSNVIVDSENNIYLACSILYSNSAIAVTKISSTGSEVWQRVLYRFSYGISGQVKIKSDNIENIIIGFTDNVVPNSFGFCKLNKEDGAVLIAPRIWRTNSQTEYLTPSYSFDFEVLPDNSIIYLGNLKNPSFTIRPCIIKFDSSFTFESNYVLTNSNSEIGSFYLHGFDITLSNNKFIMVGALNYSMPHYSSFIYIGSVSDVNPSVPSNYQTFSFHLEEYIDLIRDNWNNPNFYTISDFVLSDFSFNYTIEGGVAVFNQ